MTAAILAGGKATRMLGIPKGNLEISTGLTFIQHLHDEITKAGIKKIIISANDPHSYQRYNLPIVGDEHLDIGPLAGIVTALKYFMQTSSAVLIVPCDVPNISAADIKELQNFFEKNKNGIVYARSHSGKPQPLFAIISTIKLHSINQAVEAGARKVIEIWESLGAKTVKFEDKEFLNINSRQDLRSHNHAIEAIKSVVIKKIIKPA